MLAAMRKYLIVILCVLVMNASAQSFESLKRSKGKTELYAAVEKTLAGQMATGECRQAVQTGSLTDPYNGKTPIYLVLDYLATHEKSECETAEQVLDMFLLRKDFDVNLRYSSLMPPLAYLIRVNYEFLNGQFSKNYISDNVLKKLIEAGAEVDTYNSDGSTLMSFALDTRNEYLQSYFVKKGIDLRHSDEQGRDDIYKIIAEGNLPLLKDILNRGDVVLNFHSLKNEPKDFQHHKEMYDFLAQRFSQEVSSYDDIVLFRQKFNSKKSLVEQKYQMLAQNEINAIKTFDDIVNVEKRYPGLEIVLKQKLSYYRKDCQKLENIYNKALQSAKANLVNRDGQGFVETIAALYARHNYDPDNKMGLCKMLAPYYSVCAGVDLYLYSSYFYDGRPPRLDGSEHRNILDNALSACNNSGTGFDGFYSYAKPKLQEKLTTFRQRMSESASQYEIAYREYKYKRESMIREADNLTKKTILSRIKYVSKEWSKGRFFDTDDDFTDHKYVDFEDGISFTISWRYLDKNDRHESYYTSSVIWERYYDTDDLICDSYRKKKVDQIKSDYPL